MSSAYTTNGLDPVASPRTAVGFRASRATTASAASSPIVAASGTMTISMALRSSLPVDLGYVGCQPAAATQHPPELQVVVHHDDVGSLSGRERPDAGQTEGLNGCEGGRGDGVEQ